MEIRGTPKEIADFVLAVQNRHNDDIDVEFNGGLDNFKIDNPEQFIKSEVKKRDWENTKNTIQEIINGICDWSEYVDTRGIHTAIITEEGTGRTVTLTENDKKISNPLETVQQAIGEVLKEAKENGKRIKAGAI